MEIAGFGFMAYRSPIPRVREIITNSVPLGKISVVVVGLVFNTRQGVGYRKPQMSNGRSIIFPETEEVLVGNIKICKLQSIVREECVC
jgi:hypothetical protein